MQMLKRYTMPLLQSVVTSAALWLMATDDASTGETPTGKQQAAQDARDDLRDKMRMIFDDVFNRLSQIPTVVFVPAGTRLTVFASEDIHILSAEEIAEENLAKQPPAARNAANAKGAGSRTSRGGQGAGAREKGPAPMGEDYIPTSDEVPPYEGATGGNISPAPAGASAAPASQPYPQPVSGMDQPIVRTSPEGPGPYRGADTIAPNEYPPGYTGPQPPASSAVEQEIPRLF